MSNTSSRFIPKINDRDVIRAFEKVQSDFAGQAGAVSFSDAIGAVEADTLETIRKLNSQMLVSAAVRVGSSNWAWRRLGPEHSLPAAVTSDQLTYTWSPHGAQPDRALVLAVGAALEKALKRPLATASSDESVPASHSDVLLAMEQTAAKVIEDTNQHRIQLDDSYLARERELTERFNAERERELARVAVEKERGEKELEARAAILDERQRALDDQQKKLDDRNNTHVRRDIRASLLALAESRLENFAVSGETRTNYRTVQVVSIAGMVALSSLAILYAYDAKPDDAGNLSPAAISLAIKSALLAATAIALGAWYLRWLNRWFQRIADSEFKLQQFRLDIERASWLAETVLEWKATSNEPFPDLLVTRLSTGLFETSNAAIEDLKTPAGHLAEALFGAASSAKLRIGQQELNFDRRGIKDLKE
jgi:hypothetical protein